MIKFLGKGSHRAIQYGANNAYFVVENELYIIDCGYDSVRRIRELGLLKDRKRITILVTHMHEDHVGELIGLLFEILSNTSETKINVVTKCVSSVLTFIELLQEGLADKVCISDVDQVSPHASWEFIKAVHQTECHSILFNIKGKLYYYSSDNEDIDDDIVQRFINGEIHKLYQDVRCEECVGHMLLDKLSALIPPDRRCDVVPMHISKINDIEQFNSAGFMWEDPEGGVLPTKIHIKTGGTD